MTTEQFTSVYFALVDEYNFSTAICALVFVHFHIGFLLPILQLLTKHSVVEKENLIPIPVPSSLVLVPTPHLAHQVSNKSLKEKSGT